ASILLGSAPASVVHGDYDGDGRSDFGAVYPEDGYLVWRFLRSGDQSLRRTELLVTYGLQGDQVLNADFDADRITDLAVVRNMPSGLKLWLPNNSGNQPLEPVSWGFNSDTALTADIDGDGKSDYIVVRQLGNELMWLVRTARGEALPVRMYGFVGDELAPGDYNGDGRAELAVIRIISGGKLVIPDGLAPFYWGLAGDTSLTGHYAGTQQVSCAVFRMFNGQGFFYLRSGIAGAAAIALGAAGDIALNPLGTTRVEGSGSSSGGPTAPRLNCAARSSVSAQEDGFLWQPQAADGKLLVRFGVSRAGMVARVGLIDSGESQDVLLETLASAGLDGSGRPIYRGAAAGASYPAGVILVRQDLSGNNNCIDVALPGQQYGSL
ncbi:MAG TPA: VCBS repeat-containing protein, partial [Oligoflexia bacterium]|nr:VCBS repeat-containing protein [Oligoflexia bacterium]